MSLYLGVLQMFICHPICHLICNTLNKLIDISLQSPVADVAVKSEKTNFMEVCESKRKKEFP